MGIKNHLHIYERVKAKGERFRCTDPDCTHYSFIDLIEGNRATCGRCFQPFILTKLVLKMKVPHCNDCTRFRNPKKEEKKKELVTGIENVLKGL